MIPSAEMGEAGKQWGQAGVTSCLWAVTAPAAPHYRCYPFNMVLEWFFRKEKGETDSPSPMLVSPQHVFYQMESGERSVLLIKIGVINDSSGLSCGLGVLSIPPDSHCSSMCCDWDLAHMHRVHLWVKALCLHTAGEIQELGHKPPALGRLGPSSPFLDYCLCTTEPTISIPWDSPIFISVLQVPIPSLGPSVTTPSTLYAPSPLSPISP